MEKSMSRAKFKVIENKENNTMDKETRNKSLETAVSLIEKSHGKGSIMKLGSKADVDIEAISTDNYDATPGFKCKWCDYKDICEDAM